VATPPVELATRTKILQLDGLASTAAPAAISSPGFLGAILAQEGRPTIPYFATHLVNGVYQPDSTLLSKEDAEKKSDFILTASPSVWKKMIKKEVGFVSAFMTNKIKLDKGSPPKVIALAPKSGAVVGAFNKIDTEWPDEMSPQRLQEYKAEVAEFRKRLKV
jgi:hypothetical protein